MSIVLDFPARVKSAAPNLLDLLPIVLGLREALARHGHITLQVADMPDLWGATHFPTNTVALAYDMPDEQWRPTLVHELLHVLRGPFTDIPAEEAHIRRVVDDVEALLFAGAAK